MSRFACLSLLLLATLPATAQNTKLDPVDVRITRSAPRTDVSLACPGYGQSLQQALEDRFEEVSAPLEMPVLFDLEGQTVRGIATPKMPNEYRRHVRQALRALSCQADAKPQQRYGFVIALLPAAQAGSRVALRPLTDIMLADAR